MTEKQTHDSESLQTPDNGAILSDADYDMLKSWEQDSAAAAARTVDVDTSSPVYAIPAAEAAPASRETASARVRRSRGAVAAALTVAVAAGGVAVTHDALAAPEFSEETTTYTVQPGDGLYDAAEDILGSDSIDTRDAVDYISADPANIDVLKDGLQPGEQIVIPISVEGHEDNK